MVRSEVRVTPRADDIARDRCVECGAAFDDREGWRAYLTVDEEVALYCPPCAEHEFVGGSDG